MGAKKKACKSCRILVSGSECPLCKSSDLTTTWKGKMVVIDANKSEIAKKVGVNVKGEYAIKTR